MHVYRISTLSILGFYLRIWRFHSRTAAMDFPLRDKITGGLTTVFIVKENRKYISDKKQITYILIQNGIAIPVHFKFFRVYWWSGTRNVHVPYDFKS